MAQPPRGRGPSPRDDAQRRGRDEPPPRRRRAEPEDAPWLDEGEYEEDGPTHTLVGRRTLLGILFLLGVLTVGVVVGITLVSKRESSPIDVPAVGEEVPVLRPQGPWKIAPTGPDVDGVPVEGQGQVLFGTGDGRETEAEIALNDLPEDPLPRPSEAQVPAVPHSVDEALETGAPKIAAEPAAPPPAPKPVVPKPSVTVTPTEAPKAPAVPKVVEAPKPAAPVASGNGQQLQLGAFSSSARARDAFKSLSTRYAYLAGMEPVILPVTSDGKTLYRLRTTAPNPQAAREICGRLRVAGEACSVVQ
ncbi:hypothetical protein FJQ54_12985 [Sandaracinobacter neustonicus]|uniref:SPOR domain-containing protein n=1 Tax=Sandaracinobacter neustonicus TaxID=1715348 RepID=A0A501XHR8_9SPHN|nr:SPOR domain-containing protein [Sandaracinobacter neustonicus]TPE59837.1 hypothetical protein FJQ54_12985 [Sandaracinobacter neustonicus]